jgi:hypothetical protein
MSIPNIWFSFQRIKALDGGFSIKDTIEKKAGFSTNEGNTLTKYRALVVLESGSLCQFFYREKWLCKWGGYSPNNL